MGRAATVVYWLMLTLGVVTAQTAKVERALPQWLTGIIAVAGFLFLVFVAFLVNKAWCEKNSSQEAKVEPVRTTEYASTNGAHYDTCLDMVRSSDHNNADIDFHEKVTVM